MDRVRLRWQRAAYRARCRPVAALLTLGYVVPIAVIASQLGPVYEVVVGGLGVLLVVLLWFRMWSKVRTADVVDLSFGAAGEVAHGAVLVRPLDATDAARYIATIDDEVVAANGWSASTLRSARMLARYPLVAAESGHVAICCGPGEQVVGGLSINQHDSNAAAAHVGCWIGPKDRGRGLGAHALGAAAELARMNGIRTLHLGTDPANVAMRRTFEKAGAAFLEQRPHPLPNGSVADSLWYELGMSADA